jgi:acyl-CoA synthetase (AMP-forming)/AMP-acid ligase II
MAGDRWASTRPATASRCNSRRPGVHAAMLACEKAGIVAVGIGARAGEREVAHLVERSGARTLLTVEPPPLGAPAADAPDRRRRPLVPQLDLGHDRPAEDRDAHQARWFAFHRFAAPRRALHAPTTCS